MMLMEVLIGKAKLGAAHAERPNLLLFGAHKGRFPPNREAELFDLNARQCRRTRMGTAIERDERHNDGGDDGHDECDSLGHAPTMRGAGHADVSGMSSWGLGYELQDHARERCDVGD